MQTMTARVSAKADARVRASLETGEADFYIPSGKVPDVLRGGVTLDLRAGCYSFSDILDLVAHHLVWIGEAKAVESRLRGGPVTVRAFLKERYGIVTGASERGDKSDLKRFCLWLADARWRIGKRRAEEKLRARKRQVNAWRAGTSSLTM
jgi:hypothetical protein